MILWKKYYLNQNNIYLDTVSATRRLYFFGKGRQYGNSNRPGKRISRKMKLLKRKSNDFKAVIELTEKLREFSPNDPAKYDFAMFAFGVELNQDK